MITTKKYVRKPLYVDAVQVTVENLFEVAAWCQGEVRNYYDKPLSEEEGANEQTERYFHVRVHHPKNVRQTKAYVGDWLLYTEQGYKIYTQKAFQNSFDGVVEIQEKDAELRHQVIEAQEKDAELRLKSNTT